MNQSTVQSSETGLQQSNNNPILPSATSGGNLINNNQLQPVAPQPASIQQQIMGVPQQVQYNSQPKQQAQQTQQQQPQQTSQQQSGYYQQTMQQTQQPLQQPQMQQLPQQQQINQVQHRQYVPQGLNGGWQSDSYKSDRSIMIKKIVDLLKARKPNAPQDWLNKLPQMAQRLEESLFRSAPNFESYNDQNTLKQRLQQLAMKMKNPRQQQQQIQARQMSSQPKQQQIQHSNQQQIVNQQSMVMQNQQQQIQQQQQSQAQQQRHVVNMSDINPIMGVKSQHQSTSAPAPSGTNLPQVAHANYTQQGAVVNGGNGMSTATNQQYSQSSSSQQSDPNRSRSSSDRAQVLRHQQQRLLLLRHAAKCPHEDGRCPVTPHCSGMKRLWKHIAECKNQKCQVPHCVSSRYVLSHYHRCKDVRCPVCGPVREAIHRSHEKQKQMSQLKQGHQDAINQSHSVQQQPVVHQSSNMVGQPATKRQRVDTQASMQQNSVHMQQQLAHQGVMQQAHRATSGTVVQSGYVYHGSAAQPRTNEPRRVKPQEDLTLINCLTVDQIEKHIASLNRGLNLPAAKLKSKCLEVLKLLQSHQHGWVFNTPVDPVELGLTDYFEVIKHPMDLGTIKKRLENGCYSSIEKFRVDVFLTFDNAMVYNPEGSVVHNMAHEMKEKFKVDYGNLMRVLKAEEDERRKSGDACALCGQEKLLFEPPIFYCNGLKCSSQRIRRNSYYYVAGHNKYHWCHTCYGDLKDKQEIQMPLGTYRKADLVKKKNDEVREESWVHCDKCNRWIHQICGLFNTRQNKDQQSQYVCPRCTIKDRKVKGITEGTSSTPMAEDLQRTLLSEHLEKHVSVKTKEYFEKSVKEKAEADGISIEEAQTKVDLGGAITIRQVTSMDRKLEVLDNMKKRYAFRNYPHEFTFRCKCIVVFQNIDGVDVILFGMYVFEHDENNPAPNKKIVYLSYLDSVHFMKPREIRTFVYHEILISYLDYVRNKGFETVHIWACPPMKGDDYILYAKPETQKTPKEDRLRQWYYTMLKEAQKRGIVGKVTNMYDLYFSNPKNDASCVPYLEGDYFPGEVENTIRSMEEGKLNKKANSDAGKKKKSKAKTKTKSGRGGTRSAGLDEEALAASGILPPGYDQKSIEEGNQDFVMAKVGEIIAPMKESFMVAYLACEGAKEENMVVPKAIMEYRQKNGIQSKHLIQVEETKIKEEQNNTNDSKDGKEKKVEEKSGIETSSSKSEPNDTKSEDATETPSNDAIDTKSEDATEDKSSDIAETKASDTLDKVDDKSGDTAEDKTSDTAGEKANDTAEAKASDTAGEKANEAAEAKASDTAEDKSDDAAEAKASDTAEPMSVDDTEAKSGDTAEAKSGDTAEPMSVDDTEAKSDDAAEAKASDTAEPMSVDDTETKPGDEVETKTSDTAKTMSADKIDAKSGDAVEAKASDTAEPMSVDETEAKPGDATEAKSEDIAEAKSGDAAEAKSGDTAESKPEETDETKAGDVTPLAVVKSEVESVPSNNAVASSSDSASKENANDTNGGKPEEAEKQKSAVAAREGKFAAMEARKRNLEGNVKTEEVKSVPLKTDKKDKPSTTITVKDSKGRLVKVLDDDEEELDCEFLNSRQQFLELCQTNNYQYDQLRRAKHSSMMVLFHLHNRDAPKFVQQCAVCAREILAGYRFHCPTCTDFDLCQECHVKAQQNQIPRHPHSLQRIPVSTDNKSQQTEEQRRERQRSIQLHMTLLLHAAQCKAPSCGSQNCAKMKSLLKHGEECPTKYQGGCNICKRIYTLLQIHARQCKDPKCPVPKCLAFRERFRQLALQQRAMDDRRRQQMNIQYRTVHQS